MVNLFILIDSSNNTRIISFHKLTKEFQIILNLKLKRNIINNIKLA